MWWGKVLEGENATDKDARNLHALNAAWREDPRVENVLLPIRDGIHALRKR
jgi:predicted O-methyltransferase YrrM